MKKKIMTFTFATVFMLSAVGMYAGAREPFIKLERAGEQGLHLYMNELTDLAKLTIYDSKRAVLFRDKILKTSDFRQRFDLSELPDGNYSFEIEHGNRIKSYTFSIAEGEVQIDDQSVAIYKPVIIQDNRKMDVSLLNLKGEAVTLDIYDALGNKLIDQSFSGEQSIAGRYDLSRLPSGNYQVVIRTADRVFTEVVSL